MTEHATGPLARARRWVEADGVHIDVRGLPPPEPLVAIVSLVESIADDTVIVHHERDPQLLYPELAERGWRAERIPGGAAGEFRLRLERDR